MLPAGVGGGSFASQFWQVDYPDGAPHRITNDLNQYKGATVTSDSTTLATVQLSYAGTLCWGFTADWDLVPDVAEFVEGIAASFADLRQAAE